MNLRDRMNAGSQGASPTEIGKKMDSSSITEKSSQQSKESIMQSQSETIRRQAQEIRLLSSENLMMKKKLQEQSETIVALNGADKVLQENRMLEKQNSELRKRASEAEAEAEAVKTSYKEKMDKAFSKICKTDILHGKMSSKEKDEVMEKYKNNEISILISTTVIEVGVDVGNATVMVIFDSYRFGLSQLHQLRGRVGRNNLQSY